MMGEDTRTASEKTRDRIGETVKQYKERKRTEAKTAKKYTGPHGPGPCRQCDTGTCDARQKVE